MTCNHNLIVTGNFDCWIDGDVITCSGCGSPDCYYRVCCKYEGDQDLSGTKVHVFALKDRRECPGCKVRITTLHTVCGSGWFWQAVDLVKSEMEIAKQQ